MGRRAGGRGALEPSLSSSGVTYFTSKHPQSILFKGKSLLLGKKKFGNHCASPVYLFTKAERQSGLAPVTLMRGPGFFSPLFQGNVHSVYLLLRPSGTWLQVQGHAASEYCRSFRPPHARDP